MNPYKYGGKYGYYSDGGMNLMLATHRWYSPELMRWMTRDPIGYEGGENLYGYVSENPVNRSDPMGLEPGDDFESINAAGIDAIRYYNPISIRENREYGGVIYHHNGRYYYTPAVTGDEHSISLGDARDACEYDVVGNYHTHGGPTFATDEQFSRPDIAHNFRYQEEGFLGTPSGRILKHRPFTYDREGEISDITNE